MFCCFSEPEINAKMEKAKASRGDTYKLKDIRVQVHELSTRDHNHGQSHNQNQNQKGQTDKLYVILTYFNYCNFERRKQLFLAFVRSISNNPHIRIVVAEAVELGHDWGLPNMEEIPSVFGHYRFVTKDPIWIKESLINSSVQMLPPDWKYVAWIDADLTFVSSRWAENTIKKLHIKYDVVQLFQTCVNLGPDGEAMKVDKSFGYMYIKSGRPWLKTYKYGFWHPGYAWAMSRKAWDSLGGLIDFGILGSGDHHMALAFIGLVDKSYPGGISAGYIKGLREFQRRCKKCDIRLGYVPGTILHHWHGRLEDRKYKERWDILIKQKYDPEKDIYCHCEGLIQLTKRGERLRNDFKQYFYGRKEDNIDLT